MSVREGWYRLQRWQHHSGHGEDRAPPGKEVTHLCCGEVMEPAKDYTGKKWKVCVWCGSGEEWAPKTPAATSWRHSDTLASAILAVVLIGFPVYSIAEYVAAHVNTDAVEKAMVAAQVCALQEMVRDYQVSVSPQLAGSLTVGDPSTGISSTGDSSTGIWRREGAKGAIVFHSGAYDPHMGGASGELHIIAGPGGDTVPAWKRLRTRP